MNTIKQLQDLQSLPLKYKIMITEERIKEWIEEFGEDGCYISFSGGKDSTVLLHLVRKLFPNVVAVFVDTGLEYPEIRDFVKTFDNIIWLKPKQNFRQIITKYGYPFISKEISDKVYGAKRYIKGLNKKEPLRYRQLLGIAKQKNGKLSRFNSKKYSFLLNALFDMSSYCCNIMKKQPIHEYEKKTKKVAIMGLLACESELRKQKWLQYGCNAFKLTRPQSNPLSFWTNQDILYYIKENNIPICSVYGDIVKEDKNNKLFDFGNDKLELTGCSRTGCMFCGFGCHLEKKGEGRFLKMKETHPKLYNYIMRPLDKGGLNYKEIIDWLNENGKFNIEY